MVDKPHSFATWRKSVEVSGLFLLLLSWYQPIAAVAKETEFQLEGFILVMLSTVMAGFRWTVTQLLLQVYYDSCMTLKMMTLFIQEMETLLQKSGKYIFLQPLGSVICSRICFWFNINGWMDLLFAWICNSGILGGVVAVDCRKKNMVCFSSLLNCRFSLHLDSRFHAV
jgi:hypothetical protein